MILCFYFCMTSGYYFFKIMTSRILGPRALGPRALGPRALGPWALGPRALGPRALGPYGDAGTPRILEILPTPVPTRTWAEISQSWKPLTGMTEPIFIHGNSMELGLNSPKPMDPWTLHLYRHRLGLLYIPVRGFHDWLISAQVRVGTGGGRISRILGVPRVSQ